MATNPDRQSDGRPAPSRLKRLTVLPGGLHGVFQVAWALATAALLASPVSALAERPAPSSAIAVIELTGLWAVGAGLAWAIRLFVLCTNGRFGNVTRGRARRRRGG